MPRRQATLIQDIFDFRAVIEPELNYILTLDPAAQGVGLEAAVQWIVEEELELCCGLFASSHIHNSWPHLLIHQALAERCDGNFSRLFTRYIAAPKVYDDANQVDVIIKRWDLYIVYYTLCTTPVIPLRQTNYNLHLPWQRSSP